MHTTTNYYYNNYYYYCYCYYYYYDYYYYDYYYYYGKGPTFAMPVSRGDPGWDSSR